MVNIGNNCKTQAQGKKASWRLSALRNVGGSEAATHP